jgi:hypothetical protein
MADRALFRFSFQPPQAAQCAGSAGSTAVSGIGGVAAPTTDLGHLAPLVCVRRGIITVAPLVIGLAEALREPASCSEIIEGVMALVALVVLIFVIIISLPPEPWQTVRSGALVFPITLWLTTRCRLVLAAAAAFIVLVRVAWAIICGVGQIGDPTLPIDERTPGEQVAIVGFALCAYVLAALFAEPRSAKP